MGLLSTIGAASGRAFGLTRVGAAIRDAYFNLVTLLLPGDGTNGAQNNTFLDSSSNNFTITRNGNTTQGTFSPFSQTGWGNYFAGGANQWIQAPYNTAFDFGTGDFSVECFAYVTDAGRSYDANKYGVFVSGGAAVSNTNLWGFSFLISGGVISQLTFDIGSGSILIASSLSVSLNAWHHFVACRTGSTLSIFVDGTRVGTTSYSSAINTNSSGRVLISQSAYQDVYQNWLIGYMSNVRIIKGTQPYNAASSTITQPTSPLTNITNTSLLTCQSNRFVDNSTANSGSGFTITVTGTPSVQAFSPFAPTAAYSAATVGGSGYFDGSDWLTVGAASDWTFMHNGSDWTCEFWVYHTGTAAYTIASTTAFSAQIGFTIAINSTYASGLVNGAQLYIVRGDGVSEAVFNSTALLVPNQWNYVAITFTSSTKTCAFTINGASAGSTANTGFSYSSSNPTNTLAIGRFQGTSPGNYLVGYLGSLRISTNIRTGLTTVPTSPYTSDANTKLLTNYTNAGITDATAKNDLETVGNAQISTTQSKFGGSSMYFDGTGDLLALPNNELFNLSSGDFTIEGWFYANSTTSNGALVSKMNYNGTNWTGFAVFQFNQTIVFYHANAGSINNITTGNVITSTGTWYHIAVVKSGTATNNTKIYIDGVQQAQGTPSIGNASKPLTVGGTNSTYGWDTARELNCYIDDLRITRYARYTSAFTPPTAPFALQ